MRNLGAWKQHTSTKCWAMGARPPQESLLGTQVDKCEGTRARGSGCEQMRDAQAGGAGLEAARGQFLRDGRCRCACPWFSAKAGSAAPSRQCAWKLRGVLLKMWVLTQ